MVNNKYLFLVILFLGVLDKTFAQDRYAVFLKYKPQTDFSLDQPEDFLTDKALARRTREGITADSLDLPVSQKYFDSISEKAQYVLYSSKWLNALLLVTDEAGAEEIGTLPFVEKVELVGLGSDPDGGAKIGKKILKTVTLKINLPVNHRKLGTNENPYDFQNSLLKIPQMHEEGFTGKGVTVAVFDAGFPGTDEASALVHLQNNNQIVATRNFVKPWSENVYTANQHGTNVLSLIAANEAGVLVSGAPDADYILAITEDEVSEYKIEEYNWVRAAEFSDSLGVDIINSSVGYYDFDDSGMNYSFEDLDGKTTIIAQGANIAGQKGILIVNSIGNAGPKESSLLSPADSEFVLAIGAVNTDLEVSNFSSRGPTADGRIKPDFNTFGNGVALIKSNGNLGYSNGTSFSSPQIAGLAAGLWEAKPEWTRAEMIENLIRSATQSEAKDNLKGFGIPNFYDAYYGEILSVQNPENIEWRIFPNPLEEDELTIYFGTDLEAEFTLIDMNGKTIQSQTLTRSLEKDPFRTSLEGLKSGLYIIRMQDGTSLKQVKLIKP